MADTEFQVKTSPSTTAQKNSARKKQTPSSSVKDTLIGSMCEELDDIMMDGEADEAITYDSQVDEMLAQEAQALSGKL